jgi:4-hydroxybenzoate polyprenyltransferase
MNKLLPVSFRPYINLARLDKPIGIWLLFLPCLFGIALSYKYNSHFDVIYITFLFFAGAVIMRSAGCIINDITDRDFDKKVSRTKIRPLATAEIKLPQAIILLLLLLSASFAILLQLGQATIFMGFAAMLLVILYPFTKRFTYYPQLFLGITFNFGILMASTAILGKITLPTLLLFISAIFWTLIYDTIYAYQDTYDDIKIGVKSTALKFGKSPQKILYFLTAGQILFLFLAGIYANLNILYYLFIFVTCCHLICQIRTCNFSDEKDCLKKFKSNFWLGIIILTAIILG